MIKYNILLSWCCLLILTGCQTHEQKAYKDLLKAGIPLIENDTVTVKIGEKLFYLYSYSAGVQPIYYTLKHLNSDSTVVNYVDDRRFYVGKEDMVGGPSEGVLVFEAKGDGVAKLEFYNPYFNEMEYNRVYPDHERTDRVMLEFYKALTDSIALGTWTDAQYANYYDNWKKLPDEAQTIAMDTLLEKYVEMSSSISFSRKDQLIDNFVRRYVLRESSMVRNILDTLFNLPNVDALEKWQMELKAHRENLPIHENLETRTCYVKVEA